MDKCEECKKPISGLYDFNKPCCMVRLIANAPPHHRQAHYDKERAERGEAAANELIAKVNAERKRIKNATRKN